MAYTATTRLVLLGPMDFKIVVDETEVSASDTTTINRNRPNGESEDVAEEARIPRKFRLLGVIATLRSGSGLTVSPSLSKRLGDTDPAEYTEIMQPTPDAQPAAMSAAPVFVTLEGDTAHLRHQTTPGSASDNVARTEWLCRRGWFDEDYELDREVRA